MGKGIYRAEDERLKELEDYIINNLQDDLSLDALAKLFGKSQSQLRRYFFRKYKTTLGRFILERRMIKAFELLQVNDGTISEIAFKVGYGKRTSFTHAFTAFYGYSPNDFWNWQSSDEAK